MKWLPLLTGFALLATACAPQSNDTSMAQSGTQTGAQSGKIDCATAEADIRVLQSEQSNAMEQLEEGNSATMVPSGLVTEPEFGGSATASGGREVAATDYHEYLGDRIDRIQEACGL